MSRLVNWRRRALDDLGDISRRDARTVSRIRDAVVRYATQDIGDVVKLAGQAAMYRLRVGDWRVLFTLEDGGRVMLILRILNRRDAYR